MLGKAMAPHSSTLAWKIPWTEEPGGLQSMGSLRVIYDWAAALSVFTFMHWRRKWQPTPVFLPGESQGRGSLVGCRLWGRTELGMTKVTYQHQCVCVNPNLPIYPHPSSTAVTICFLHRPICLYIVKLGDSPSLSPTYGSFFVPCLLPWAFSANSNLICIDLFLLWPWLLLSFSRTSSSSSQLSFIFHEGKSHVLLLVYMLCLPDIQEPIFSFLPDGVSSQH